MGLDTSHDCWHGGYIGFNTWRTKVAEVAGFGNLREYDGYAIGGKPWPENDPFVPLLYHSDCDGDIAWESCGPLADALEQLLPSMRRADLVRPLPWFESKTKQFIKGLREAFAAQENVEFH